MHSNSQICVVGLAVMGQNLALNVAEKGFPISVYNRSYEKTEMTVKRAAKEGLAERLTGYDDIGAFVASIERPRSVVILVKAFKLFSFAAAACASGSLWPRSTPTPTK